MIHVATVHYRSSRWIDLQLVYLRRHLREPYRVVASLEGIDEAHHRKFDLVVPSVTRHEGKLNLLATVICSTAHEEDLIMFLDGDAFPIANPMPLLRNSLTESALVAVRRDENVGDKQPHPLFCVTSVRTWRALPGDWSSGHPWLNDAGELISDVGGNLLYLLEQSGTPWTPLLRTNRHNLHPVHFGVYGGVVYHHGAGFRGPRTRHDRLLDPPPTLPARLGAIPGVKQAMPCIERVLRRAWRRRIVHQYRRIDVRLYELASRDPNFYLLLL